MSTTTPAEAYLKNLPPLILQGVLVTSLLLQRHTILKTNDNFLPNILTIDITHKEIINFAIKNAEFKDFKEYFHLRNEVFYVDSLIENVELDVNIILATEIEKCYKDYDKEEIIKRISLHPLAVKTRNEDVGSLMKLTIPLRERKFLDYMRNITEVDFKEEISIAAKNICRQKYGHETDFYRLKAKFIYGYVIAYLQDKDVQKILVDDPYNITKYFLSLTTSILMESLKYSTEEGLGIFAAGNSGKASPLEFKIGLDDDGLEVTSSGASESYVPQGTNTIEDIDSLLESLKK